MPFCLGDQFYASGGSAVSFWGRGAGRRGVGFGNVLPVVEMIRPRGLRLGCGQRKGQRSSYCPNSCLILKLKEQMRFFSLFIDNQRRLWSLSPGQ